MSRRRIRLTLEADTIKPSLVPRHSRHTRKVLVNASAPRGHLVVYGPAQLVWGATAVRLHSKGLALLYLLALEGTVRRERIAELLWSHRNAANNLRVELHRLRVALAAVGLDAFPAAEDPLQLPRGIELDRFNRYGDGTPLQGLDDLSRGFQAWLEAQRDRLAREQVEPTAPLRFALVERVAREARQPLVLVLRGPPGTGRRAFLEALSRRLDLPLLHGTAAGVRALHLMDAEATDSRQTAEQILQQRSGIWALMVSPFGPDCELLLQLRQLLPAERVRFLTFGAVPWHEVRALLLARLPFAEAARIYVSAGGHLRYMQELLRLRPSDGFDGELPLPQRIRAAYLLEIRHLPEAARPVLDHLAVHPGGLPDAVLAHLGFADHLDTLEMAGWLRFDGHWSFCDDATRRVIARSVQLGRRTHYHARFAQALAATEPDLVHAAAYHRSMAGLAVAPDLIDACSGASLERRRLRLHGDAHHVRGDAGRERAILLERHRQLQTGDGGVWSYWVRQPLDQAASYAEFALPDEPCLVRLRANLYHERLLGAAQDREAFPLRLWCLGGPAPDRHVVFGDAATPAMLDGGALLLQESTSHDVFLACHHRRLLLEFQAETGIAEFSLQALEFRPASSGTVHAFDLCAPSASAGDDAHGAEDTPTVRLR